MPTVNIKDIPESKMVNLVDLSEDTINKIAEIVAQKIKEQEIDTVEVVRCKDCKHYWKNKPRKDVPVCLASPKDDAFCSEGERKEDGKTD